MQPIRQSAAEPTEPFGKYHLLRLLARGGMAEIYLARQAGPEGFDRKVVIKRILPSLSEDPSFVAMFLDEARLASRLGHPNIAHIYDFGEVDGSYYLCMEYIPGVTLSQLVRSSRIGLPVEHAVKIACFLLDGLHYAHALKADDGRPLGIVHRDVSPQNVIVSESGGVKLLDFGIAHAVDQVHTTQQGVVKGKVSYMSPEQCRGRPLDGRSDNFSVATLIWESLTMERLFTRGTSFETMEAITRVEVPPLSTYRTDIPDGLDEVLAKAFAKKVDDRYPNAAEMQLNLERYLSRHQLLSSPPLIAQYLHQVMGESPPAPAIGEDEPQPGETTPARRLPKARRSEKSGMVEKAPPEPAATVVAAPRDMTLPRDVMPTRTGKSGQVIVGADPLASGDGPTMHSISSPSEDIYVLNGTPVSEPIERFGETIRRVPRLESSRPVAPLPARSKFPWLALAGFLAMGLTAGIVATILRNQGTEQTPHAGPPIAAQDLLPPLPVTPTLDLRSEPPGATVRIDGIATATAPATLPISVGPHRLTFEKAGFTPEDRDIRVQPGQPPLSIAVTLRPLAEPTLPTPALPSTPDGDPSAPPDRTAQPRDRGTGMLSVDTNPWSRVFVNGRSLGETPVLSTHLPSGVHTLTFMVEGRRRVSKRVSIREGQHTKVTFRLGGD